MFLRGPLLAPEGAQDAAGAAAPPAPATAPQPPPAPPPAPQPAPQQAARVDVEALKAEARKQALADLGFESEEDAKADREARKKAEEAKLTEAQRTEKALKESLDARGKLEEKLAKAAAKAADLEQRIAMRDKLDTVGVNASDRDIVEVLLGKALATDKGLDEAKWFETLRKERPYLFGSGQQLANTGPAQIPAGSSGGASPFGASGVSNGASGFGVDLFKMPDAQYREHINRTRLRPATEDYFQWQTLVSCPPGFPQASRI